MASLGVLYRYNNYHPIIIITIAIMIITNNSYNPKIIKTMMMVRSQQERWHSVGQIVNLGEP